MIIFNRVGLFISSFLLISACKSTKLETQKTVDNNYIEPQKTVSTVAAPIRINLNEVTQTINRQFYSNLYSDNSFDNNGNDNLKLVISKRNLINVNATGNTINIRVPLNLEGTYRFKKSVLGMDFSKEQNFNLNLTAIVKSLPSLNSDWNLNLKSTVDIVWEDLPVLDFAGFRLDFPKMFSGVIKSQTALVSNYIDSEIPKIANVRQLVNNNWQNLTQPYMVNAENNAWLILRPKSVFITPLEMQDSIISITTGISTVVELVSGFKPEPNKVTDLPPLRQVRKLNEKVNIVLSANITYQQINDIIKSQLGSKGMWLKSTEYNILVTEATTFGSGDKIGIAVKLAGKVKKGLLGKNISGTVYLEGKPVYNALTRNIEVKSFDFTVNTKDVLVKSASWLLNSKPFKNAIEKKLVFDVSNEIENAKNQANDALNKRYGNYLNLLGSIYNIEPKDVYVSPTALSLDILAEGRLNVVLGGF